MAEHFPQHYFVSYSRDDEAVALEVRALLEAASIPVWVDTKNVLPGTPNWERTIREALASSFGVIFIGSPSAAKSAYVQAELSLANSRGLPIFPLWAAGETWIDCAPLLAARIQYIDVRAERHASGLEFLTRHLRDHVASTRPAHLLVKDPYGRSQDGHGRYRAGGLEGYVSILLGVTRDAPKERRDADELMAVFNAGAYATLQDLLNDLYLNYLADRFAPLTYGQSWILHDKTEPRRGGISPKRLIVPWSWMATPTSTPISALNPAWGRGSPLDYGLTEGTVFLIEEPDRPDDFCGSIKKSAYGIAVNNSDLLHEMLAGPGKQPWPSVRAGFVDRVDIDAVTPDDFKHAVVVGDIWSSQPFAGHVLRESTKPFDWELAKARMWD